MNNLVRYTINFILSGIILLFFRSTGWIVFVNPPKFVDNAFINDLLTAGIIAMVIFIIGEILGFFFKILKKIFFFAGCILSIVYFFVSGYLKLFFAASILADWFAYNTNFFVVLIMIAAIGFIRLPHFDEMSKEEKDFWHWKKQQKGR